MRLCYRSWEAGTAGGFAELFILLPTSANVKPSDPGDCEREAVVCTALSACWLTLHGLLERTSTTFLEEKQTVFLGYQGTQSFQQRSFKCIKDCLGPNHRD